VGGIRVEPPNNRRGREESQRQRKELERKNREMKGDIRRGHSGKTERERNKGRSRPPTTKRKRESTLKTVAWGLGMV